MKLHELLDVIDYNRDSTTERIQICRPNTDWDDYDECSTSSCLLVPFYEAEIKSIGAVEEDVIRVDLDWDKLDKEKDIYGWGKKTDE